MAQPEEIKAQTPPEYRRKVVDNQYARPAIYYMRSGAGGGGRLMRMRDVVVWLMDACDIPRSIAVEAVCKAFENRADTVFIVEEGEGEYARLITSANSFDYRMIVIGDYCEEKPKFVGLAGALNRMRTCWPASLDTAYLAAGLDKVAVPYDLVCALFVAPAADANTPYQPQTLDDVVKARTGPRKGTEWLPEEIAILRATYQQSLTYQQIADRFSTAPDTGKPYITGKRIGQLIRTDPQETGKRQQNRLNKAA